MGAPRVNCFRGFGYNVILGDDLRKPACMSLVSGASTLHAEGCTHRILVSRRP